VLTPARARIGGWICDEGGSFAGADVACGRAPAPNVDQPGGWLGGTVKVDWPILKPPRTKQAAGPITVPMSAVDSSIVNDFSLVIGGPFYRLLLRLGLVRREPPNILPRILILVFLTWIPLLVLSLLEGVAYGGAIRMPFLYDFAAYARFLVALPLLIVAEVVVDPLLRLVVRHFVSSGLVPTEETSAFERLLQGVGRLRDSALAEGLALILAFLPLSLAFEWRTWSSPGMSTWQVTTSGSGAHLSMAGWWYFFVAGSIVRFIFYRWLWRLFVWSILLKRVSRLNLRLVATHPDLAGGLGFVTAGQIRFGILFFAGGAVIAATMANAIAYGGATLHDLQLQIVVYVVVAPLLVLGPLFLLAPRLVTVRRHGLLDYATLASQYTQSFDLKWVQGRPAEGEPLLGTGDIQSLADLANSFAIIRQMRVVPIFKSTVIQAVLLAGTPFLPLFLLASSVDKILATLLKMLV